MTQDDKSSSQSGQNEKRHSLLKDGMSQVHTAEKEEAFKAELNRERERLTHRPTLHIRTRITVAFLFVFTLCAVITLWIIYTLSQMQTRIHFLEVADNYVSEIQQARRFEKNYLLYRTNLEDAFEHLENAQNQLKNNRAMVRTVLGSENLEILTNHVNDYSRLLGKLRSESSPQERKEIEAKLRDHGAKMISFAMDFAKKERMSVDHAFLLTKRIPLCVSWCPVGDDADRCHFFNPAIFRHPCPVYGLHQADRGGGIFRLLRLCANTVMSSANLPWLLII